MTTKTFDQLRSKKKPVTQTVEFVADSELAEEYQQAAEKAERAKRILDRAREEEPRYWEFHNAHEEAEKELEAFRERIDDDDLLLTVKVRTVGRVAWEDLITAHPPTDDQEKKLRQKLLWNADTFPPALIAACAVEPAMTEEQAGELWSDPNFAPAELQRLFEACQEVNTHIRRVSIRK